MKNVEGEEEAEGKKLADKFVRGTRNVKAGEGGGNVGMSKMKIAALMGLIRGVERWTQELDKVRRV